jgi:hypothetical protein
LNCFCPRGNYLEPQELQQLQLSFRAAGAYYGRAGPRLAGRRSWSYTHSTEENRTAAIREHLEQTMAQPRFPDDPAFKALRLSDFESFNRHVAGQQSVDFSNSDLRGVDFRGVTEIEKIDVRGSYMRDTDLRGLDLRAWDMKGCSLYHAKISGAYFPTNLSPQEITASVQLGTRMRTD